MGYCTKENWWVELKVKIWRRLWPVFFHDTACFTRTIIFISPSGSHQLMTLINRDRLHLLTEHVCWIKLVGSICVVTQATRQKDSERLLVLHFFLCNVNVLSLSSRRIRQLGKWLYTLNQDTEGFHRVSVLLVQGFVINLTIINMQRPVRFSK